MFNECFSLGVFDVVNLWVWLLFSHRGKYANHPRLKHVGGWFDSHRKYWAFKYPKWHDDVENFSRFGFEWDR